MSENARINELRRRYHENPKRFFAPLANEYRKSGYLDRAILLCEKHLPEQPENMNGHVVFGQTLFEAGQRDAARGSFERALELDPENLIALRHLGDIARLAGDVATAKRWYERVLEFDHRNDELRDLLQQVSGGDAPPRPSERASLLDVDFDFAETADTGDIEPPSGNPEPRMTEPALSVLPVIADFALEDDDRAPAAASAPHRPPALPFVTETIATLYLQQGHIDEAIGVYRQLVAQAPNDAGLRSKLAELERQQQPEPAPEAAGTDFEMPEFEMASHDAGDPAPAPANAALDAVSFSDIGLTGQGSATPVRTPQLAAGSTAREFFSGFARRAAVPAQRGVPFAHQGPTFDQFFQTFSLGGGLATPPAPESPARTAGGDGDRFQDWLQELKT